MFRNGNQTPGSVHTLGKLDSPNHRTDSSERASKSASIATSARGEANMPIPGQNDGGLLKLPPELRLMIYDLLLVDLRLHNEARERTACTKEIQFGGNRSGSASELGRLSKKIIPGAELFYINRQIYEEVSEAFYGSGGFDVHIYANGEIADEGSITVLNKRIPAALIEYITWLPLVLRRVRHLHLRIHANAEPAAICEAQNVLHASLTCLGKSHALKTIHVAINVGAHRPGRSYHAAVLKPRSSPPSQVIDFLTAPVQAIRMGPSQRKALKLTMTGDEGQPLTEIARTTMIAIYERTPLRDFRPMMRYFSTLKAALRCAESRRRSATNIQNVDSLIRDFSNSRLRRNIAIFRFCHSAVAVKLVNIIKHIPGPTVTSRNNNGLKETASKLRELAKRLNECFKQVIEMARDDADSYD
ncbi:hypothetical protein LTR56_017682 [Elasticomyces elasticus]|nr:hypothetical protein LTR56_017682 [Elasticomyces elasticus]KAK3643783.1 hypothetical protein LTR22_015519 [Elasticomyces elasticus]KAK4912989.1 hypothetical protein LTR49_018636 [Elasticomyces elasticus]KAK5752396.1 hypothetical protein LTS12_017527 [Elasticomyces elasticus]